MNDAEKRALLHMLAMAQEHAEEVAQLPYNQRPLIAFQASKEALWALANSFQREANSEVAQALNTLTDTLIKGLTSL